MKISKKIEQSSKAGKVWWSFEYFPPRTAQVRLLPGYQMSACNDLEILLYPGSPKLA